MVDPKPEAVGAPSSQADRPKRMIKRYSNRKLYDAGMVREGEEVQIIDNNTKDDLTEVTLAQIIYEEQKAHSRSVPLQTLKELIHSRTEKVLADLREGPIGRLIPGGKAVEVEVPPSKESKPTLVDQAKERLEVVHHQLDERIQSILTSFRPLQQLQQEVRRLNERIDELERALKGRPPDVSKGSPHDGGS
jgi:PHB accumulation regulatory protein